MFNLYFRLKKNRNRIYPEFFVYRMLLQIKNNPFFILLYFPFVIASKGIPQISVVLVLTSTNTNVFLSRAIMSISQNLENLLLHSIILYPSFSRYALASSSPFFPVEIFDINTLSFYVK